MPKGFWGFQKGHKSFLTEESNKRKAHKVQECGELCECDCHKERPMTDGEKEIAADLDKFFREKDEEEKKI